MKKNTSILQPNFDLIVKLVQIEKLEPVVIEIPSAAAQLTTKKAPKPSHVVTKNIATPSIISLTTKSDPPTISTQKEVTDSSFIATESSENKGEAVAITSPKNIEAPIQKATPSETQNTRGQYGALLAQEIAKFKQYPALAKQTRQQGVVILQLEMNNLGKLITAKVYQSSSYELLDNQALDMVKKASPFSQPPMDLHEHDLSILVPVSFRLK